MRRAIKRRDFIKLIGGAGVWPAVTHAQVRKPPIVGVLWHAANAEEEGVFFTSLLQGFHDLGYVEGRTLLIEHTYAAEQYERFQTNAKKLVADKVDVIVAVTRPAAMAAQRATSTIPVVFAIVPDPVGLKLVASLARPGGNVTGLSNSATDIAAKRIELLKEAFPKISRVALLVNPNDPIVMQRSIEEAQTAAGHLKIEIYPIEVRSGADFVEAFAVIDQRRLEAVATGIDPMIYNERKQIAELARSRRLPTVLHVLEMVDAGGLMSYAPSNPVMFRRTAAYVDKILKGASPSELPVEQPTKFDLVINLKTADAIGVTIPSTILLRADRIIE